MSCSNCHAPAPLACRCGLAAYCAVDCQKAAWPAHKAACVASRAAAAAAAAALVGTAAASVDAFAAFAAAVAVSPLAAAAGVRIDAEERIVFVGSSTDVVHCADDLMQWMALPLAEREGLVVGNRASATLYASLMREMIAEQDAAGVSMYSMRSDEFAAAAGIECKFHDRLLAASFNVKGVPLCVGRDAKFYVPRPAMLAFLLA
jgi:hypothetical protein